MKISTIDFETSNVDPNEAKPTQFAWFLEDTKKIIKNKEFSFRIIFSKTWDQCSKSEKDSLEFGGISSFAKTNQNLSYLERIELFKKEKDKIKKQKYFISIQEHNSISREPLDVIKIFLKSITNFGGIDILSGYNIINYDNIVLKNWFETHYNMDFFEIYTPRIEDVYLNYLNLAVKEKLVLPSKDVIKAVKQSWGGNRYFVIDSSGKMKEKKGLLKLQNLLPLLFGPDINFIFHQAIDDVKATIKARIYFKEMYCDDNIEMFLECVTCGRVVGFEEEYLSLNKNEIVCKKYKCLESAYFKIRKEQGLEIPEEINNLDVISVK